MHETRAQDTLFNIVNASVRSKVCPLRYAEYWESPKYPMLSFDVHQYMDEFVQVDIDMQA